MKAWIITLIVIVLSSFTAQAQVHNTYTSFVVGTNFPSVKRYDSISPLFSLQLGINRHNYVESEILKKQNYKNIKYTTSFTLRAGGWMRSIGSA
ncbi:hypothetical protein EP331_12890 [bacterium]|nr:MAG: hypothetical protein EP331_12890 [bacterium]